MTRLVLIQIAAAFMFGCVCHAQSDHFEKTKLASPTESRDIPVNLNISDDQVTIRGRSGPAYFDIPFSSITRIAYTENSHHRLGTGAMIAMVSPVAGAATMLSKRRDEWMLIEWVQDGSSSSVVLLLDKHESYQIRDTLQSKSGKPVQELQEKSNPFDPARDSVDIDETVPFGSDQVLAALTKAMPRYGCVVEKQKTLSVLVCRRKHGNSELTGFGGETVIAQLNPQGTQTGVRIQTKAAAPRTRNWSSVIFHEAKQNLTGR